MATGFGILDIAIGLILVYLVLSLICSAAGEIFEAIVKFRSRDLERGIRELLNDPDGTHIMQQFYHHPMINGLFRGKYDPTEIRGGVYSGKNLPSYVPAPEDSRPDDCWPALSVCENFLVARMVLSCASGKSIGFCSAVLAVGLGLFSALCCPGAE